MTDTTETAGDIITVRLAEASDIEVTSGLAQDAQVVVRDERGGRWHLDHDTSNDDPSAAHAAAVAADDRTLIVGCLHDVVVGYALAELSPGHTTQLCMISELIVHPDARAIGVGSAILDRVRAWAVAHDCAAIESQVLPGNRAAKNFFERVGMKTRKMRVSADLR